MFFLHNTYWPLVGWLGGKPPGLLTCCLTLGLFKLVAHTALECTILHGLAFRMANIALQCTLLYGVGFKLQVYPVADFRSSQWQKLHWNAHFYMV